MPSWVPRWMRWTFPLAVTAAVVAFVISPQLGEAEHAWDVARRINPWLLFAAVAAQLAAVACQAELTRTVLRHECRPTFASAVRVEVATMAVSHTVPGGTAAGTAVAYRLLTEDVQIPRGKAGFALAIRGVGSAVVLNAILWLALLVSIPGRGFDRLYTVAAGLGVLLIGGVGLVVWLLMRGGRRVQRWVSTLAARLPVLDPEGISEALRQAAAHVADFARNRRLALVSAVWSAGYWLFSAASLWILLAALGQVMRAQELLVAFGLANVLAALPVTPRGLGLVEGVLIPSLIGFGVPGGTATVAVLAWRLFSFWLPIPLGGLAYASLKVVEPGTTEDAASGKESRSRLGHMADAVRSEVGSLGDWAHRHGLRLREDD